MPQSTTIWHTGNVTGRPSPTVGGPSLSEYLDTSFTGTYSASTAKRMTVVGATDIAPFTVALDSISKVRFLGLRVVNGASLKLLLTSASGTDQAVKVSSLWLWHSPNAGDEITAIKLVGTADIELMIAGDVS
jgi:hypothetical protein